MANQTPAVEGEAPVQEGEQEPGASNRHYAPHRAACFAVLPARDLTQEAEPGRERMRKRERERENMRSGERESVNLPWRKMISDRARE